MAEYQNIFTRVQVRGPAHAGVALPRGTWGREGTPFFVHLFGRIGCFLVGDDYGTPSNLPWAVAFPEGLPPTTVAVHPTQLYEAVGLAVLGWLLLRWRGFKHSKPFHSTPLARWK